MSAHAVSLESRALPEATKPRSLGAMALKRMDNIGIVVDDLESAIDFLRELGLEFEGRAMIEGEWAGRVTGLCDQRVEIAMMCTGRPQPAGALPVPRAACHRRSPERPGEHTRLSPRGVHSG